MTYFLFTREAKLREPVELVIYDREHTKLVSHNRRPIKLVSHGHGPAKVTMMV